MYSEATYIELHARSAFSFLRAGSTPEALVKASLDCQLPGFALCDRDGFYGSVRHYITAREHGGRAYVGCELTLEDGTALPLLVACREGYRNLCHLLTTVHLRSPKGEGRTTWAELASHTQGLFALTGDEEGPLRHVWREQGPAAADAMGQRLLQLFGPHRLYVELQRHRLHGEEVENAWLVHWARQYRLPLLATNGVCYATPEFAPAFDVLTCLREKTTLDAAGRLLARNRERHMKSAAAMHALFADLPEAVANTVVLAQHLGFTLDDLGYQFPEYEVPAGHNQDSFLREMTYQGARERYGEITPQIDQQLERELGLIQRFGFSGYFLIVWSICEYARSRGSLIQGRGSAANSAVCYALKITAADPIGGKLLFERFLSEGRSDWPDIDLDLPSGDRREEVIQEVYRRYGRRGAAMTANVISFRGRSTFREVGKTFGMAEDVLDRFSQLFAAGDYPNTLELQDQLRKAGVSREHPRLHALLDCCHRIYALPRHLGQHSGGMVISSVGLDNFVPLENARMPGRSVLQWDKNDCEDMRIIKIDLLGLGMMAVLQESIFISGQRGRPVDIAKLPKDDPETFDLIQKADTVGLFQIESRAQMSTLPRMKPASFYDLVVEVAIIRPGPIQGDAVHPYLERRANPALVTYPDERAKPILERTLGVVLFQEQILRLAMELGGFTAGEADELRRAIGFTRSPERLKRMQAKLAEGLRGNGVNERAIETIQRSLASFALYGFPESHAISFALIAYASAWLKVHRGPEFFAALLNNQPMGFYSPASLIQDARRRGLRFLPVCVVHSGQDCTVVDNSTVRLGLKSIRGLNTKAIKRILETRALQPFLSLDDFLKRTRLDKRARELLAEAGAFHSLARHRREALWHIDAIHPDDTLFHQAVAEDPPEQSPLPAMTLVERIQADYRTLGLTAGVHPMALVRSRLPQVIPASSLPQVRQHTLVWVAGSVTTRQRPGTAKGICFITLEDETGLTNVIVYPDLFEANRLTINLESSLKIYGELQHQDGVTHILARKIEALALEEVPEGSSYNYH